MFEDGAGGVDARLVLIAEDEPDNREIMRTVVEDLLGMRAMMASDGETAIRLAATAQPALVLMDLMMPILDGFGAIARLRAEPATANLPIIAVSALGRPTDRQRALDTGATDYINKPFDQEVLAECILRHAESIESLELEP
jgi:CheY-like chemotaxis protein